MVRETKLYDLLGVSPQASDAEIKKGYRKMALKYHPDKPTGDTEKFKQISEAFEILSSKDKRSMYDQFGLEAARQGGPLPGAGAGGPGGFGGSGAGGAGPSFSFSSGGSPFGGSPFSQGDAFRIFEQFSNSGGMGDDFGSFGGFNFGGGGMPGGRSAGGSRGGRSAGGMPGGFGGYAHDTPEPETVTLPLSCTLEELYTGKTKKLNISRKNQHGTQEKQLVSVNVTAGWKSGTKITYKGIGDWTPHGRQTVKFVLEEKSHPLYTRDGDNLKITIPLSFKESLLGFRKEIKTLGGKTITIDRATPISPSTQTTYPGQGMPISKQPGKFGDLFVSFKVDYPISLTANQKAAIQQNF